MNKQKNNLKQMTINLISSEVANKYTFKLKSISRVIEISFNLLRALKRYPYENSFQSFEGISKDFPRTSFQSFVGEIPVNVTNKRAISIKKVTWIL